MSETQGKIAQFFDSFSDNYDESMKRREHYFDKWVANHIHDLGDMRECRVLDVGCGTGRNVAALCEHRSGIRAAGVDVSPGMLKVAQATGRYEHLYTHDLNRPLSEVTSDSFDLVMAISVLELLQHVNVCLSECRRVLKDNGLLWLSFRRYEADDEASPPRHIYAGGITLTGYSAAEILNTMRYLHMPINTMEQVTGYITRAGFSCPYYAVGARKVTAS